MGAFDGKVALITGAGGMKGIGRACALRLAAQGADIVLTDYSISAPVTGVVAFTATANLATRLWPGGGELLHDEAEMARRKIRA